MLVKRSHIEEIEVVKNQPLNQIYIFDDLISADKCKDYIEFMEDGRLEDEKKINPFTNVNAYCYYLNTDKHPDVSNYFNRLMCYLKNTFYEKYNLQIRTYDEICFRKIFGKTRYHFDDIGGYAHDQTIKLEDARKLSFIVALNDSYDGGEIVFPAQDFKIKLKRGQGIAFPPYWTHPHYTNEPENNTVRYTINTWLY